MKYRCLSYGGELEQLLTVNYVPCNLYACRDCKYPHNRYKARPQGAARENGGGAVSLLPWTGPGCPYWDGPPSKARVDRIESLTMKDRNDTQYYRRHYADGWRRLRTKEDYDDLNRVLG